MASRFLALVAGLLLTVCACEPEATPLPVNLDLEATAAPQVTTEATPATVRYALAPNLVDYFPDAVKAELNDHTEFIALDAPPNPADLGTRYDIVVSFGELPNGEKVAGSLNLELALHPSLGPTSDANVYGVIQAATAPQNIIAMLNIAGAQASEQPQPSRLALREALANAGYPDGLDITFAASRYAPGQQEVVQLLEQVGIHPRLIDLNGASANDTHLVLDTQYDRGEPFLDYGVIGRYSIPIRYAAVPNLTVTLDQGGFPLADWQ